MFSQTKKYRFTISGHDQPGITASLFEVLSRFQVTLLDIEQVVISQHLTLGFVVEMTSPARSQELIEYLRASAQLFDLNLECAIVEDKPCVPRSDPYVLTLLGDPISPKAIQGLAQTLARYNANIDGIRKLSQGDLSSLEITTSLRTMDSGLISLLKSQLMASMAENNVDVALQKEQLSRKNKRLVVMDMDSTLIDAEVIDELAAIHGVGEQVSAITRRSMEEGFDFQMSLRQRVCLLKGLEYQQVQALVKALRLNPGASTLIACLKKLGYKVGVISGGFTEAADHLSQVLELDFAFANRLEVVGGKLSGKLVGDIIDAQAKKDLLVKIASETGIPLEQTIAIGDGANDALMLGAAGLGIGFKAKAILREQVDANISQGGLDRILYFLGISAHDFDEPK